MRAGDIARSDFASVTRKDSVLRAARLMVENHIHALPVLDDSGALHCVVNATDIIALAFPAYLDEIEDLGFLPASFELPQIEQPRLDSISVDELCAARTDREEDEDSRECGPACDVAENDTILEVARLFVRHGAEKCPVIRDGKVVGIIDPLDLLETIVQRQG
jgi:CBS domain-containing protein